MDIIVNGETLAVESGPAGKLGEALAQADDLLEKAGSVIVSLRIDGAAVDADSYGSFAERPATDFVRVDIAAEPASAIRIRTLETLHEVLKLSLQGARDEDPTDWRTLRTAAADIGEAFAGLFSADELSFVQAFAELLARTGDDPGPAERIEITVQGERLRQIFGERLAELREPLHEMRKAAAFFESQAPELEELPVLLQTGKDDRAMKAVTYFIEVFNKVIRIVPELGRAGVAVDGIRIEGRSLEDFYVAFNAILRQLTEAFEHKDAVLIGDLAEYEILPRMRSFFAAMDEAMPPS
ncbi:MAG TPA: hypothetical protein VMV90_00970 [Rectinemataceae bacterium]|nr:hypothetical protein [Rectinemataceae bacterium]